MRELIFKIYIYNSNRDNNNNNNNRFGVDVKKKPVDTCHVFMVYYYYYRIFNSSVLSDIGISNIFVNILRKIKSYYIIVSLKRDFSFTSSSLTEEVIFRFHV